MEKEELLRKIGLTKSESKVFIALLKIGDFTAKGKIVDESKIAPSKIYDILNKLIEKGLVSTIIKNNIKHFIAANPEKLLEYTANKKVQIIEEEKSIKQMLPELREIYASLKKKVIAEVFIGWKGMENVYSTSLESMKKSDKIYILGASKGNNQEKTKEFFLKYSQRAKQKEISAKVIFNENARSYVKEMEKELKIRLNKKFLFKTTPVEVAITKDVTAIIILKEEPIVTLIHDKETAESFVMYFNELWKIAKK